MSQFWAQIASMQRAVIASLPNLILAVVVFGVILTAARGARKVLHHFVTSRKNHRNLALVLERLVFGVIVLVAVFVSLSIVIPSFKANDLIQLLGIGGVAFGFAFKDIFQNFLSGILILLTDPFKIGDTIVVDKFEGVVEDIQTRATFIKTSDGQRIVIPNTELFINPVTVQTAYDVIRKDFSIKIPADANFNDAINVIREKLCTLTELAQDPKPTVYISEIQDTAIVLKVYFWFDQTKMGSFEAINMAINKAYEALAEHRISTTPIPQKVLYLRENAPEDRLPH